MIELQGVGYGYGGRRLFADLTRAYGAADEPAADANADFRLVLACYPRGEAPAMGGDGAEGRQ